MCTLLYFTLSFTEGIKFFHGEYIIFKIGVRLKLIPRRYLNDPTYENRWKQRFIYRFFRLYCICLCNSYVYSI